MFYVAVGKGEAMEAKKLVIKALDKGVQSEEINRSTLIRLNDTMAAANTVFPHTIPEKVRLSMWLLDAELRAKSRNVFGTQSRNFNV